MRTDEINWCILHIYKDIKSPFLNIYIRFYDIDSTLISTLKVEKSYRFKFKGAYFNDLSYLLEYNNSCDYFDKCDFSFKEGTISCHGHGEFFGTDILIINFRRIKYKGVDYFEK